MDPVQISERLKAFALAEQRDGEWLMLDFDRGSIVCRWKQTPSSPLYECRNSVHGGLDALDGTLSILSGGLERARIIEAATAMLERGLSALRVEHEIALAFKLSPRTARHRVYEAGAEMFQERGGQ